MNHYQQVKEFMRQAQEEDPEKFEEVCNKYPTLSMTQWNRIRDKEISKGLVGLEPVPIDISSSFQHNIESSYAESEEEL